MSFGRQMESGHAFVLAPSTSEEKVRIKRSCDPSAKQTNQSEPPTSQLEGEFHLRAAFFGKCYSCPRLEPQEKHNGEPNQGPPASPPSMDCSRFIPRYQDGVK